MNPPTKEGHDRAKTAKTEQARKNGIPIISYDHFKAVVASRGV